MYKDKRVNDLTQFNNDNLLIVQPISFWIYFVIVSAMLLLVIILGLIMEYSDRRVVSGYVRPIGGSIKVFAKSAGVVDEILVRAGDQVGGGHQVILIKNSIASVNAGRTATSLIIERNQRDASAAGEQLVRNDQLTKLKKYEIHRSTQTLTSSLLSLEERLRVSNEILSSRKNVLSLVDGEDKGAVSRLDREKLFQDYLLQKQQSLEIENEIREYRFLLDQLDVKAQHEEIALLDARADLNRTLSSIEKESIYAGAADSYYINSPKPGVIANLLVEEGQSVSEGTELFTLLPGNIQFEVELLIDSRVIGSVQKGQEILLRYESFPHQVYGIKRGIITYIDDQILLPDEMQFPFDVKIPVYRATVSIEDQSVQLAGVKFPLKSGMRLSADILLEKKSLFKWIFEPIYLLFH